MVFKYLRLMAPLELHGLWTEPEIFLQKNLSKMLVPKVVVVVKKMKSYTAKIKIIF